MYNTSTQAFYSPVSSTTNYPSWFNGVIVSALAQLLHGNSASINNIKTD